MTKLYFQQFYLTPKFRPLLLENLSLTEVWSRLQKGGKEKPSVEWRERYKLLNTADSKQLGPHFRYNYSHAIGQNLHLKAPVHLP